MVLHVHGFLVMLLLLYLVSGGTWICSIVYGRGEVIAIAQSYLRTGGIWRLSRPT